MLKMRRYVLIFFFLLSGVPFFPKCSFAKEADGLIPVTIGDVQKIKTFSAKEKMDFVLSYYIGNKKNGATDEEILNELIKLLDLTEENAAEVKKWADAGRYYRELKDLIKAKTDEIKNKSRNF